MHKTLSKANTLQTRNPLIDRDPQLVERLATFAILVNDMLLDQLAAKALRDRGFRAEQSQHSFEEVQATAQVLRVLTKSAWDASDLRLFDGHWRQASFSNLFAEEFEPERHRIASCVEAARKAIHAKDRIFG